MSTIIKKIPSTQDVDKITNESLTVVSPDVHLCLLIWSFAFLVCCFSPGAVELRSRLCILTPENSEKASDANLNIIHLDTYTFNHSSWKDQ